MTQNVRPLDSRAAAWPIESEPIAKPDTMVNPSLVAARANIREQAPYGSRVFREPTTATEPEFTQTELFPRT